MDSVEMKQTKLRLTTDKRILASLRRRKRLVADEQGERYTAQFDGKEFVFRPGITMVLGATVAKRLIADSQVLNGENDLTDPLAPALVSLGTYNVGEKAPDERDVSLTSCHVCLKEQHSFERLAAHIKAVHAKEHPEQDAPVEPADATESVNASA